MKTFIILCVKFIIAVLLLNTAYFFGCKAGVAAVMHAIGQRELVVTNDFEYNKTIKKALHRAYTGNYED